MPESDIHFAGSDHWVALLYCLVVFLKSVYFCPKLMVLQCVQDFHKVICFRHIKGGLSLVLCLYILSAWLSLVLFESLSSNSYVTSSAWREAWAILPPTCYLTLTPFTFITILSLCILLPLPTGILEQGRRRPRLVKGHIVLAGK